MSYDIAIKVDPAQAEPAIAKVSAALGKAEEAGDRVGKVASKGLRETGLAAEKAKAPTDNLAKAFGGLNAELAREAAMLDRLRGPSLRYNEDLRVLDRLLDQNKISVAEYTAELTKMNRALEQSSIASGKVKPPDMKKTLGGAAKTAGFLTSGAGGLLAGVESGLAIGGPVGLAVAAAPAIQKVGEVAADAADRGLTKLANVLNADFIAIRKANEAFIARMQILRQLVEEEDKTTDAVKAAQNAMAAGVNLAQINESVALSATRSRVALQAAFGVDLSSSMGEAEKKAREFAGALQQLEQSDAAAKLSREVARTHQSLHGMSNLLRGQIDDWQDMTVKVKVLAQTIAELNQRRGAAGISAIMQGVSPANLGTKTRQDVDLERKLRDETLKLDNANNIYGKTVVDIKNKTNQHRDALADLKGAYKAGEISAAEYRRELAALGAQFAKLPEGFKSGKIGGVGVLIGRESERNKAATGWGKTQSIVDAGVTGPGMLVDADVPKLTQQQVALNAELAKTPTLLERIGAEAKLVGIESLEVAFRGLEDQLVSLATTGKFSFSDLVNHMLAEMTRLVSQKIFAELLSLLTSSNGGGANAITAAAGGNFGGVASALFGGSHAFGGDYRVGGSGGPDSQRVMFNLSPGEHVRFTPPGRDPDASRAAAAPVNLRVINVTDSSAILSALQSSEGERVIMNVIDRAVPALRGRITGR